METRFRFCALGTHDGENDVKGWDYELNWEVRLHLRYLNDQKRWQEYFDFKLKNSKILWAPVVV